MVATQKEGSVCLSIDVSGTNYARGGLSLLSQELIILLLLVVIGDLLIEMSGNADI